MRERRVFKYTLEVADRQELDLPVGAEILSVGWQQGQPRLWALVDPAEDEKQTRFLRMHGTGHPVEFDGDLRFIGTAFVEGGVLVFHFFEEVC